MIKTFEPFFRQGPTLELGCFQGEFTSLIMPIFKDLTVVEASDELISIVKKRVGDQVEMFRSTFERANLSKKYDAIFLIHTLEHLDDPVGVLKKINGWLSNKGRLFLAVPDANAPSRQIAVKMGLISHNSAVTEGERIHGHRKTYGLDTLESEVQLRR